MLRVERNGLCALWVAVCLAFSVASPVEASAQETPVVEASKSMQDNLSALSGKTVTLHLAHGQTLSGKVAEVSATHVRIAELSGKEFFDALVRVDAIVALEVRARSH